jgi:hypothetical protein
MKPCQSIDIHWSGWSFRPHDPFQWGLVLGRRRGWGLVEAGKAQPIRCIHVHVWEHSSSFHVHIYIYTHNYTSKSYNMFLFIIYTYIVYYIILYTCICAYVNIYIYIHYNYSSICPNNLKRRPVRSERWAAARQNKEQQTGPSFVPMRRVPGRPIIGLVKGKNTRNNTGNIRKAGLLSYHQL